jgi:SPP1 gp7 family putative phage head morphogenesis protein
MKDGVIEAEKELNIDVGFSPEMMKETKVLADRQLEGFYIEGKRWKGLKGVAEDVQLEVSQVVRDGIVNKEGLGEIKKQIKERLDVTSSRAEAIARTETTRFSNHAKIKSYEDSGIVESIIWDAHLDNRTSPICEKLNDQKVPLGKFFQVETNKGLAEFSQPPAHVNCRSVIRPVLKSVD